MDAKVTVQSRWWIEGKGEANMDWVRNDSKWVWFPEENQLPRLRVWFRIPAVFEVLDVRASEPNLIETSSAPAFVDVFEHSRPLVIYWKVKSRETQKFYQVKQEMRVEVLDHQVLRSEACEKYQITVINQNSDSPVPFLAFRCGSNPEREWTEVTTARSVHWQNEGKRYSSNKFALSVKEVDEEENEEKIVYLSQPKFEHNYRINVRIKGSERFHWNVGTGLSYISYVETIPSTEIQQVGLTLKSGASYHLSSYFSVGLSGYFTLVPFLGNVVPAGESLSRFFGLNARVGYRLPFSSKERAIYLSPGFYFWGMTTPSSRYGISSLSGPQLFVLFRSSVVGSRRFYFYMKYAPVIANGSFLRNRELAVGGGYQMTSFSQPVWMLTLDISNTQAQGSFGKTFSLYSYSLGLQRNF